MERVNRIGGAAGWCNLSTRAAASGWSLCADAQPPLVTDFEVRQEPNLMSRKKVPLSAIPYWVLVSCK